MERKRFSGVMLLFIVLAVVLITQVVGNLGRSGDVSYSDMRAYFTAEKVKSFTATDTRLVAKLQDGSSVSCALHSFDTFYNDMNDLVVSQAEKGVITSYDYAAGNENGWLRTLLPYVLAAMAFILLMNLIARMGGLGGGAVNDKMARFGEARIQDIPSDGKKVTFKDVAGADEEKEELEEIVQFLRDPQRYTELGAHIPKGVLLVGPPGTGKTLLAKAVAGEADTAFLSISGSDFVEMYVGVGASRVRDLFEQAKKQAPAIVFIDEIDAVGRQRGSGLGGGHDEREQTLNQLLVEMDGFAANEGVVVLAATNRVDILDPALLRPGRFDRQVFVGLPDIKGREEILKIHAKGKPLAEDVDLGSVARATSGFTGADLENLLNEAALLTGRRGQRFITEEAIHQSVIKVIAGPEKHSRVVPEAERRLTAYHEAGHAVVMQALPDLDPVHQITIVPRGQAGGMTIYLPEEDRSYLSKQYMEDQIAALLGGRVAALIYNAPKAGPSIETMSWAIFLLGLHQVSTGILQGLGKTKIPVFNMILAAASKVLLNWNLTPTLGIVGSSWATVADIGIAAVLNLFFIKKYTGFSLELKQLGKTALAAVAMGAAVKGFLALVPGWGAWSILGGMAVAVPVYGILLLGLKTMPEEELYQIPFLGRRMVVLGKKLKLL